MVRDGSSRFFLRKLKILSFESSEKTLALPESSELLTKTLVADSDKNCYNHYQEVQVKNKIMTLDNYFEFLAPNDIRIKGHRIGIENILHEYLFKAKTAEEIAQTYKTLTLEQIYATILYYLQNQESVNQYIENWLNWSHQQREEQRLHPSPIVQKLKQYKAEKLKQLQENVH